MLPELLELDEALADEDRGHEDHLLRRLLASAHDRLVLVVLELEPEHLGGDRRTSLPGEIDRAAVDRVGGRIRRGRPRRGPEHVHKEPVVGPERGREGVKDEVERPRWVEVKVACAKEGEDAGRVVSHG